MLLCGVPELMQMVGNDGGVIAAAIAMLFSTRLVAALVVTLAFAVLAYAMRAVTRGGALAGAAVSFVLYVAVGPGAFIALVAVFLLAMISTRLGYTQKQALGKAESRKGRSAAQILANLAVPTFLAALAMALPYDARYFGAISARVLIIAAAGALAEAAADTVSSECGEAWSSRVRLITTWNRVPPGTDGGISVPGTAAGAVAALALACVCAGVQMITPSALPIVAGAAILGVFFDSVLGATLQRRGVMGNNTVNVAGTTFAALVAVAFAAL